MRPKSPGDWRAVQGSIEASTVLDTLMETPQYLLSHAVTAGHAPLDVFSSLHTEGGDTRPRGLSSRLP